MLGVCEILHKDLRIFTLMSHNEIKKMEKRTTKTHKNCCNQVFMLTDKREKSVKRKEKTDREKETERV